MVLPLGPGGLLCLPGQRPERRGHTGRHFSARVVAGDDPALLKPTKSSSESAEAAQAVFQVPGLLLGSGLILGDDSACCCSPRAAPPGHHAPPSPRTFIHRHLACVNRSVPFIFEATHPTEPCPPPVNNAFTKKGMQRLRAKPVITLIIVTNCI